jgi:5-methylcytosine-specific restriction endonuclease McrA
VKPRKPILRRTPLRRSTKPIARSRLQSSPRTRKKRQTRAAVITANRVVIFDRDACCRRCGAAGRDDDHCHEVKSRADLRGRPPEDIFNRQNCLRLCERCHLFVVHGWGGDREDIVYDDAERGCDGPVRFVPRPPKPRPWQC